MEFYIGDKKYNYTEEQLELHLLSDEGTEGNVYEIKGQAVKIYKPYCQKTRLNEKQVEELKQIETERLLLPIETVYNETRNFNGYTTRLIRCASKDNIRRMKMTKMLEEMRKCTEDVRKLSKLGISINDLNYDNIVFGDGIYVCDPGSFIREEHETEREIERENKYHVNTLFIDEIFGLCCGLTKKQKLKLKDIVSPGEYLSEMLSFEDINQNETTLHFVKRITK